MCMWGKGSEETPRRDSGLMERGTNSNRSISRSETDPEVGLLGWVGRRVTAALAGQFGRRRGLRGRAKIREQGIAAGSGSVVQTE